MWFDRSAHLPNSEGRGLIQRGHGGKGAPGSPPGIIGGPWRAHRKLSGQIFSRHVCATGGAVEAEAFGRLAEVTPHVLELVGLHGHVQAERIDAVDGHQAGRHGPAMPARQLVLSADVARRAVVRADVIEVRRRVGAPHRLAGEVAQPLVLLGAQEMSSSTYDTASWAPQQP